MTVSGLRARVRRLLNDSVEPYRWSDAELRDGIQAALRRLNTRVPSTRYALYAVSDFVALPELDEAEIQVDGKYDEAVVMYAAHLAYLNDATDTVNAERASALLVRAESLMV